jgi:hypothetical protein
MPHSSPSCLKGDVVCFDGTKKFQPISFSFIIKKEIQRIPPKKEVVEIKIYLKNFFDFIFFDLWK